MRTVNTKKMSQQLNISGIRLTQPKALVLAGIAWYFMSLGFGTLEVYLHNLANFPSYSVWTILALVILGSVPVALIALVIARFISPSWLRFIALFLLGMAFLVWLERFLSSPGNSKDMVMAYGEVADRSVVISMLLVFGVIELIRRIRNARWEGMLVKGVLFLTVINALSIGWTGLNTDWSSVYQPVLDESVKFNISKSHNVFVFILDTFQSGAFAQLLDRDPKIGGDFKDFTYYPDVVGCHPGTYPSIPCFLTGKPYIQEVNYQDYLQAAYDETSLLKQLKDRGFINHVYQPTIGMPYDPRLADSVKIKPGSEQISRDLLTNVAAGFYRGSMAFVKVLYKPEKVVAAMRLRFESDPILNTLGFNPDVIEDSNDVRFALQFVNNVNPIHDEPVFTMYHFKGVHLPLNLGPNFMHMELDETRENYLIVAENKLHIIALMLERLKELNLYDSSTIVIAGDHGAYFDIGLYANDVLTAAPKNVSSNNNLTGFPSGSTAGLPLLLIKEPSANENVVRIDTTPLSMMDFGQIVLIHMEADADVAVLKKDRRDFYFTVFDLLEPETRVSRLEKYEINGRSWWPNSWKKVVTE